MKQLRKLALIALCVLLAAVPAAACAGPSSTASGQSIVRVLNWGDYIDPSVIGLFEEENPDIKLSMTTTDSNEAMYVTASTEGTQIDVVIPSEYMIQRMMNEQMLAPLDHALLPNYSYVAEFTKTMCGYDPEGEYSVPYAWGTFGILYNADLVNEAPDSWEVLFDPEYAGSILMYDSIRDSIGTALLRLGYSINTTDPEEIAEASQMLIDQKPLVLAYGTDDLRMSMANGSAALSVMYAGDAVYAMEDNDSLQYVIPKEGANIFVDSFAVLASTDVYDESLRFINFMLRPDIAALNATYTGYSSPEPAAVELIAEDAPELMDNPAFVPDPESLVACQYYVPLSREDMKKYELAWLEVKVA